MISVIVPAYNESGNVGVLFDKVSSELSGRNYEVIFINDGSSDDTLDKLKKLAQDNQQAKYISFSRNFGHQAALRAGLAYAVGEAVISMDADLQHPPRMLPDLLREWESGYEVVYTIRKDSGSTGGFKNYTSRLFYKTMNFLSDLDMDEGAADFRLLDRKVVDVVNAQQEADIFLRGYINWIGFRQKGIEYSPDKRHSGQSKYTLKKMISFALQGVTQFSIKPLRLAYVLALVMFAVSLLYLVYAVVMAATGNAISGWLSTIALIVFMQGFQFMLLGMIGEYLGRTFMQTKHRPEYIVSETNANSKKSQ